MAKNIVQAPNQGKSKFGIFMGIFVILVIVAVVGAAIYFNSKDTGERFNWSLKEDAPQGLQVSVNDDAETGAYISFYTNDTDRTLDLYSDARCPVCGQLEEEHGDKFRGEVADGKSVLNVHMLRFLDEMTNSDYSTNAASTLITIAESGDAETAWNFYSTMWENQPEESTSIVPDAAYLASIVEELGGDQEIISTISEGADNEEFVQRSISADTKNSEYLENNVGGVSTPTLLLDGEHVENPRDSDSWTS